MKADLADIDAVLIRETPAAMLLDVGQDEPIWMPKSACQFDEGVLTMPEPLAIEKGLV